MTAFSSRLARVGQPRFKRRPSGRPGYVYRFEPSAQTLVIEPMPGGVWVLRVAGEDRLAGQGQYSSLRSVREHIHAALKDAANAYEVRW